MDFDKMKRPTDEFNKRSEKLSPQEREALEKEKAANAKPAAERKDGADKLVREQQPNPGLALGGAPKRGGPTHDGVKPKATQNVDDQDQGKSAQTDAGVNQQEKSKFVNFVASMQKKADAQLTEPTKGTAQVGADSNEQQLGNSVDRAANMRQQFNNAAQKKGVDESKFTKKP
jgi:hypothetical protein